MFLATKDHPFDQVPKLSELFKILEPQNQSIKPILSDILLSAKHQFSLILLLLHIQSKSKLEKRLALVASFTLESLFKGENLELTEKIYQAFLLLYNQDMMGCIDELIDCFSGLSDEGLSLILTLDRNLMLQHIQELQWLYQHQCQLIWVKDQMIDGLLRVKGKWLDTPRISVVGTRKPDQDGKLLTQKICKLAAENQVQVLSGGASGIDEYAHLSTLEHGGHTMIVVGSGLSAALDHPIFKYQEKQEHVTWVSPFQSFLSAAKWTFLARNEWIAYLCHPDIVYVIQAGYQSGTLSTAKFAMHHHKKVWVCPGPVESPLYKGSHQLIRDGAKILIDPLEPLEKLIESNPTPKIGLFSAQSPSPSPSPSPKVEPKSKLWHVSSSQPLLLSELSDLANLSMAEACVDAIFLEMDGWLVLKPGGRYTRGYGK